MTVDKLSSTDALPELARTQRHNLIVSTLLTAQDVISVTATEERLRDAIAWCLSNGITKVYLEIFRDACKVPLETLAHARDAFRSAGFDVSGCLTPTEMGDRAQVRTPDGGLTESRYLSCYLSPRTQEALQGLFVDLASLFDEIILDDFFSTECVCDTCMQAKGEQPWPEFRTDLMLRMSRERILEPVRQANRRCKVIIKYPNWYDHYRVGGYDVDRQSKAFDFIYSGTETRDPVPTGLPNAQYQAYFTMRWLTAAGGEKNLGGWFDYIETKPATFVEQAHQTVLGGAGQLMLYAYGSLRQPGGTEDMDALRQALPALFKLAVLVKGRVPKGILACKPTRSSDMPFVKGQFPYLCAEDQYVFGFLGMLGLPLIPAVSVDPNARTAVFTRHGLYDEEAMAGLETLIAHRTPVLLTQGLARELGRTAAENVQVLEPGEDLDNIDAIPISRLNLLRDSLLAPWSITFHGPAQVGLYLFADDLVVVANFNDREVQVDYSQTGLQDGGRLLVIPETSPSTCRRDGACLSLTLAPRSMIVLSISF